MNYYDNFLLAEASIVPLLRTICFVGALGVIKLKHLLEILLGGVVGSSPNVTRLTRDVTEEMISCEEVDKDEVFLVFFSGDIFLVGVVDFLAVDEDVEDVLFLILLRILLRRLPRTSSN